MSSEQLDLLLSFMEDHPDFASGKQSIYSRFSSSKLWRLLAERLNAAASDSGGALKTPDKWCKVSTVPLSRSPLASCLLPTVDHLYKFKLRKLKEN